jgi:hypothetical protein
MLRYVSVAEQTTHRTPPESSSTAPTAGSSPAGHASLCIGSDDSTDDTNDVLDVELLDGYSATDAAGLDDAVGDAAVTGVETDGAEVSLVAAVANESSSLSPHPMIIVMQHNDAKARTTRLGSIERCNTRAIAPSHVEIFTALQSVHLTPKWPG